MANELEIPAGVKPTNNVPTDAWYGPYADLAAARTAIPTTMRLHRTVGIITAGAIVEYWWKSGSGDADLEEKIADIDNASELDYGLTSYGTQAEVEDAADNPTLASIPDNLTAHLRGLRWFINRIFATARAISGVWTAPTPALGTNTTQLANAEFVNKQIDESIVDRGTVASGTLTLDFSRKNHKVTLTGNINLDYTNLTPGREIKLWITRATDTTITPVPSKFAPALKQWPGLTNPLANGSSPAKAVDILSFVACDGGALPTVSIHPDIQTL